MNKSPAFLIYASDFLSDENVKFMNNRELGCYIKLIMHGWIEGSIPSDIRLISKLCGEPENEMAQLWLAIKKCFLPCVQDISRLVNPRQEHERKKQAERRRERSESGKKGAKSKWCNIKSNNGSANGSAINQPMANDGFSYSYSISDNNKKSLGLPRDKKKKISSPFPDDFGITDVHKKLADEKNINVEEQLEMMKDWAIANGVKKVNWDATFRNWLKDPYGYRAQNKIKGSNYGKQKSNAEIMWESCKGTFKQEEN